jgi:proline racemase
MWARGELKLHQDFVHESVVGSKFVGRLEVRARV